MTPVEERSYAVAGMSCEHCRAAVAEEVGAVAGVSDVAVDLAAGVLIVRGAGVREADVMAAVARAGYEVRR